MRCCFCGHGREEAVPLNIFEMLVEHIENLIIQHGVNEFYSGGMGIFDSLAEKAVIKLKEKYSGIKLFLVIPYLTKKVNNNREYFKKRYDEIIFPELGRVHYKAAIHKRNRWMIDNSEFMVAYVKNEFGGAWKSYNYAKKRNIKILNLACSE